jgi:Ca2+-binding RTX toxin-like protein
MHSRRALGLAVPLAGVLTTLALTGGAATASADSFTCSASALQVSALGLLNVAPEVANSAGDPCVSDSAQAAGLNLGLLSTGAVSASTSSTSTTGSSVGQVAGINLGLGLPLPLPISLPLGITVTAATSTANASCVNGSPSVTSGSTVVGLMVAGQYIPVTGQQVQSIPLGLLGVLGVATVNVDQTIPNATGTGVTQDAVDITIAGGLDNGVKIVLGEASAGADGNPCASTTPPTNPPGTPGAPGAPGAPGNPGGTGSNGSGNNGSNGSNGSCPDGTTLVGNSCELLTGGSSTGVVVSSAGSNDVSGGSVISLTEARKLYGNVSCLNGAGPKFVVVGTRGNDRITVRKVRMRVLGLGGNDRITVDGGNRTCANGGAGNDTIINKQKNRVTVFGANGNDHITLGNGPAYVLGGKGSDRIIAGNGKVNLQGNAGADYIKAGNGADTLNGGSGNDVLIAGNGRAHLNGGPGNNKLTAHGKVAYVQAGKGHSVAYVKRANMRYARLHGVATVHAI